MAKGMVFMCVKNISCESKDSVVYKSQSQDNDHVSCGTDWGKLDVNKVYQLLCKLLSEEQDYEVRFTVTRKDECYGAYVY